MSSKTKLVERSSNRCSGWEKECKEYVFFGYTYICVYMQNCYHIATSSVIDLYPSNWSVVIFIIMLFCCDKKVLVVRVRVDYCIEF